MTDPTPRRVLRTVSLSALVALTAVGAGIACSTPRTDAAFTDEAAAVVEASGAYDIAVEARTTSGTVEIAEGNPEDMVLATPEGARFTLAEPVEWRVSVLNRAAAGDLFLTISDPEDTPFSVGATHFPDLFHALLFTVTDTVTGEVLLADATSEDLTAHRVELGNLDTGERRDLAVSAVVAPGTWSVYDSRTTSLRLTFQGTT